MSTSDTDGPPGRRRRALATGVHLRRADRIGRHAAQVGLGTPVRRAITAGLGLILVGFLGVVATAGFGTATAENGELPGRPVPADLLPVVHTAALSCPALTPARLAGQVMAASGFDANARSASGATGIAGLTADTWDRWKPASQAQRTDPKANIVALAHATCDLVGQVRQAGVGGDRWRLALGAYHSGVAAVRTAKGVPPSAASYVDTVARHAAWYAAQPEFAGASPTPAQGPSPSPTASANGPAVPRAVPTDYLPLVLSAGRICPKMSPARVAAQLMAASAFNPNLLGAGGAQGIAGFTPQMWTSYAPRPNTTSPWDPTAAIPALGRTMCSLMNEVSGLATDPYPVAIAAFVWGPDAVKQAGELPPSAALRAYVNQVQRFAEHYANDPKLRLGASPTVSGTPGSPAQPTSGSARPTGGPRPSPSPTPTRTWGTLIVDATAVLHSGEAWKTDRLSFTLRTDGEIALVDQGRTVWRAGTAGRGGIKLVFQADGNMGLYNSAGAWVWSTSTENNNGARLTLQDDGNVTISINGRYLWNTGTQD